MSLHLLLQAVTAYFVICHQDLHHLIGYTQLLRNIAVGLGNAPSSPEIISALKARESDSSELLREHVCWALRQHQ